MLEQLEYLNEEFTMKTYISIAVTASFLLFSSTAFADSCEQAAYFYEKGQFRSARTVLEPLMKKGEACAEYYMGLMYQGANGVKQNETNRLKGISLIKSAKTKGYPAAIKFMNSYH